MASKLENAGKKKTILLDDISGGDTPRVLATRADYIAYTRANVDLGDQTLSPGEGFRLWAESYDEAPNPLLRLEERLLPRLLGDVSGLRIVDCGCGTGRWLTRLRALGARAVGFDAERAMLGRGPDGTCLARLERPPIRPGAADLVLCSFALSYAAESFERLADLVAPGGLLLVSDLHPEAVEAGWSRGFRSGGRPFAVEAQSLDQVWEDGPGWEQVGRIEASFGEPERRWFDEAGRAELFEQAAKVKAVKAATWRAPRGAPAGA